MPRLDSDQLLQFAATLPGWQLRPDALRRSFEFPDFVAAIQFVNDLAVLAERQGHHPDIDIRYNRVSLTLSSHDSGGVTERDVTLATAINQLKSA